jgi:hypothetical protein
MALLRNVPDDFAAPVERAAKQLDYLSVSSAHNRRANLRGLVAEECEQACAHIELGVPLPLIERRPAED